MISADPRELGSLGSAISVEPHLIRKGLQMFAVPSAILVLATGYLNSPVAASVCSCGASPARDAVVAACCDDSSDFTPVLVSLPGASAFSPAPLLNVTPNSETTIHTACTVPGRSSPHE